MKNLCINLSKAQSEDAVKSLIDANPILKNQNNWRHYGLPNNLGTITGQSPESVPSLIEKVTNSIDAMLIRKCKKN